MRLHEILTFRYFDSRREKAELFLLILWKFSDTYHMTLAELKNGQSAVITKIKGHGAFRKRVMEMGFVQGREVTAKLKAPLQDPIKYSLMGYDVSLRRAEALLIECVWLDDWIHHFPGRDSDHPLSDTSSCGEAPISHPRHDKEISVALIGNPNCGKTSLFNTAAGAHEHVGNYAGVTVDAKEGYIDYKGYRLKIVDLPGTYSLSAYSPEEEYVLRYLRKEAPDVIVNVVVASNLERNLYLTTELIDMNRSMVIDLNMYDELQRSGSKLDYKKLGKLLGVPIIPTVASSGKGIDKMLDTVIAVYEQRNADVRHIHVTLGQTVEKSVRRLTDAIKADGTVAHHFSPRYIAIKLLQGDPEIRRMVSHAKAFKQWTDIVAEEEEKIRKEYGRDAQEVIAGDKYGFVQGALAETYTHSDVQEETATRVIDMFVTNKLFGFPIFLLIMWLMFWATFQLGQYPMDWIEAGVSWIGQQLGAYMPAGPLKDMLIDGVIGGVGGVIVFLPNILILYGFISFLEDSGYMARVAFIMDKVMHRLGLHGKSFIPLVMGFGCNVPAIMSSRIIESKSSRLITILITPFMSCSARIPIYVLLCGCFFPNHASLAFLSLYVIGILLAVITARLLRRFWFKKDETPFVMELPPYRMPTLKATCRGMWDKARQYLKKMGGLILVASIIIWALSYFPRMETPSTINSGVETEAMLKQEQQSQSYLGRIGHFVEPVVKPLGFDWKMSVSLIAGSAAKEVVVSTLGVLYTGQDDSENLLAARLTAVNPATGKAPLTPLVAYTFLIFVLIYFPCIATLAAIIRETGHWSYGLFSVIYNTGLAYIISFVIYQVGNLL